MGIILFFKLEFLVWIVLVEDILDAPENDDDGDGDTG